MAFADVHYQTVPPVRTDNNEIAAPGFRLRLQRPTEPWQRIPHRDMVALLSHAQGTEAGLVICAGCGRELELPFMELDHITPKSDRGENHILNRILLCRPCNGHKRDNLTLQGLMRQNRKNDWMRNKELAQQARDWAQERAEWVRDHYGTTDYWELLDLPSSSPGYPGRLF